MAVKNPLVKTKLLNYDYIVKVNENGEIIIPKAYTSLCGFHVDQKLAIQAGSKLLLSPIYD